MLGLYITFKSVHQRFKTNPDNPKDYSDRKPRGYVNSDKNYVFKRNFPLTNKSFEADLPVTEDENIKKSFQEICPLVEVKVLNEDPIAYDVILTVNNKTKAKDNRAELFYTDNGITRKIHFIHDSSPSDKFKKAVIQDINDRESKNEFVYDLTGLENNVPFTFEYTLALDTNGDNYADQYLAIFSSISFRIYNSKMENGTIRPIYQSDENFMKKERSKIVKQLNNQLPEKDQIYLPSSSLSF